MVWQSSKEKGTRQMRVKKPKHNVAKRPMAEAIPAVGELRGARKTEEAAAAAKRPEKIEGSKKV